MPYSSLLYPEPCPCDSAQIDSRDYLHKRDSNTVLSQSLWSPWVFVCTRFFEPFEHLWREWGLILNMNEVVIVM